MKVKATNVSLSKDPCLYNGPLPLPYRVDIADLWYQAPTSSLSIAQIHNHSPVNFPLNISLSMGVSFGQHTLLEICVSKFYNFSIIFFNAPTYTPLVLLYTFSHMHISLYLLIYSTYNAVLLLLSHSVMSDSLQPHGLQHTRLTFLSPSPRAYLNSNSLSQGCHPTILSTVIYFSSCR